MQSGIAPCPGKTTRSARADRVGIGGDRDASRRAPRARAPSAPSAGCPCRSRRCEMRCGHGAAAELRERLEAPLVEGIDARGARVGLDRHAQRARERLEDGLAWWCALSPRRLSMCTVASAWFTKPWKNSCARSTSNSPMRARVNFDVVLEPRAARRNRPPRATAPRRAARRRGRSGGCPSCRPAPWRAPAERDADVLDGVVRVDVQVALGAHVEVDHAVARDLVEHVVEERHAGGEAAPRRAPSRSSATMTWVSLVLRWTSRLTHGGRLERSRRSASMQLRRSRRACRP